MRVCVCVTMALGPAGQLMRQPSSAVKRQQHQQLPSLLHSAQPLTPNLLLPPRPACCPPARPPAAGSVPQALLLRKAAAYVTRILSVFGVVGRPQHNALQRIGGGGLGIRALGIRVHHPGKSAFAERSFLAPP